MANRSQLIKGRIQRKLQIEGAKPDDFAPDDLYDLMQIAQDQIFSRIGIEYELSVTTISTINEYALLVGTKKMIGPVITVVTPDTWEYELELIEYKNWNETIKTDYGITQPIKATIFENNLILYPTPDTSGEIIKFWVYLEGSQTEISSSVAPELKSSWDSAIEDYVMWRITGKESYLKSFEFALDTIGQTEHDHGLPHDREVDW
jgi:hypothetical protein